MTSYVFGFHSSAHIKNCCILKKFVPLVESLAFHMIKPLQNPNDFSSLHDLLGNLSNRYENKTSLYNPHCVKSVRIRSIQSECRWIRARITPKTDTFYAVPCKRFYPQSLLQVKWKSLLHANVALNWRLKTFLVKHCYWRSLCLKIIDYKRKT